MIRGIFGWPYRVVVWLSNALDFLVRLFLFPFYRQTDEENEDDEV